MSQNEIVVGIDLGTTNSEIAAYTGQHVEVLSRNGRQILPSCVGVLPSDELVVGEQARNQQVVYPERTVRSIKRRMGTPETVELAGRRLTPQEISSFILKELASWAEEQLGQPVRKAVITVPAYFSDAQRQATREAGALAGLEVVRIINEPTAAGLAYGYGGGTMRSVLVYDLGGGTFDVSLVHVENDVTEVLASHGNNRLGGDDFDELLARHLQGLFEEANKVKIGPEDKVALSRLFRAAEEAKIVLSAEPYARVREEALVSEGGRALHLDAEVSREDFEKLIRPLAESTLASVSRTLADAGKKPADLDAILLVGGSSRIPLISRLLHERTGIAPRQEIHPELCVALGAGVLASRIAGQDVEQALIDVCPYSFGISHLAERGGMPYPHCYKPLIERNTPLPITRTERYYTSYPGQTTVEICVYEGEDEDALRNVPVGHFLVHGLTPGSQQSEILVRMNLNLDGILRVTAVEKATGRAKEIRIADALTEKTPAEIAEARKRLAEMFGEDGETGPEMEEESAEDAEIVEIGAGADSPEWLASVGDARRLLERSRSLAESMNLDDRELSIELNGGIEAAIVEKNGEELERLCVELRELLFFVEGRK